MTLPKSFYYFMVSVLFLHISVSCKTDTKEQLSAQIKDMEQQLFENNKGVIDSKEAANIINLYCKFADGFPEDERSASYLFKAADVSINVFHSPKTIELFDRVITEYPEFEKAPQALFLKAFTYENYLNDLEEARASYELFLLKYPDHSFANDAQVSLDNLGKSPEEIIKAFNESNK